MHSTFNLRQPIDEQIERARKALKKWQNGHIQSGVIPPLKDKRVKSPELLAMYLRVLDAEVVGAKPNEVAERLSQEMPDAIDADHVKKWLAAARRYRDRDYVLLLERIGDW